MREPKFKRVEHLAVWDWQGEDDGPLLLMCHATGFHGRCWDRIIRSLPEHWRVIAVDLRGHGASGNPPAPVRWKMFGEDLVMLIDAMELDAIAGVGHSMGGHSVVHAAAMRPLSFRSLLLLDPVIRQSAYYGRPWMVDHFARKRRNQWQSPEEMYERFRVREPFLSWDQQTLRDYCQYALKDGVLACTPEFEASVYEHSSELDANLGGELGAIAVPVTVMRSHLQWTEENGMNGSPTDPRLAARFQRGSDVQVPFGHFFPMEAPSLVIEKILGQQV